MVILEKARWKNINATGDVFTEVDLESSPLTLFVGKNGAGKTTLLDVLCFVLFKSLFVISTKISLSTLSTVRTPLVKYTLEFLAIDILFDAV